MQHPDLHLQQVLVISHLASLVIMLLGSIFLLNHDLSATFFPLENHHIGKMPTDALSSQGLFDPKDACGYQHDLILFICNSKKNVNDIVTQQICAYVNPYSSTVGSTSW